MNFSKLLFGQRVCAKTRTKTKTKTRTKTRTDLLRVGSVGGEAPGLLHLLLARWVPAVVVPPHDLRVVQRLDDDLILPRLAESTRPGEGGETINGDPPSSLPTTKTTSYRGKPCFLGIQVIWGIISQVFVRHYPIFNNTKKLYEGPTWSWRGCPCSPRQPRCSSCEAGSAAQDQGFQA